MDDFSPNLAPDRLAFVFAPFSGALKRAKASHRGAIWRTPSVSFAGGFTHAARALSTGHPAEHGHHLAARGLSRGRGGPHRARRIRYARQNAKARGSRLSRAR